LFTLQFRQETVRDAKLGNLQQSVKDAICNKLQHGDTDYDTIKKLDKSIDCVDTLTRAGVGIVIRKYIPNCSFAFMKHS